VSRAADLCILPGDAHPDLARAIAHLAGLPLGAVAISAFADGETRVRIEEDVAGRDVILVQPTSPPVNDRLMTLALLADAARAAGAAHVAALIPYFGYARQDVRKHPGEPRSAQLAARLLAGAGIEQVVTLELHSPALENAFPMPVAQLAADELLRPRLAERHFTIVSPDAGGLKRAQRYARELGAPLAAVAKARPADDAAAPVAVLGDVRDKACVIVDDLASTGRTVAAAARALAAAGAAEVHACFVHAVMAEGALARMRGAGIGRIVTTDSVGPVSDADFEVVSVAPLFAAALRARLR
jgi:ribose-phosphate pyrophosphokinase